MVEQAYEGLFSAVGTHGRANIINCSDWKALAIVTSRQERILENCQPVISLLKNTLRSPNLSILHLSVDIQYREEVKAFTTRQTKIAETVCSSSEAKEGHAEVTSRASKSRCKFWFNCRHLNITSRVPWFNGRRLYCKVYPKSKVFICIFNGVSLNDLPDVIRPPQKSGHSKVEEVIRRNLVKHSHFVSWYASTHSTSTRMFASSWQILWQLSLHVCQQMPKSW